MKLLFICSQNRLRSPTGEAIFKEMDGFEARSAGTNHDAPVPVSDALIEWSDMVVFMERHHRNKVGKKFRPVIKHKRMVVLDIPDDYECMDPVLIRLIKHKMSEFIGL